MRGEEDEIEERGAVGNIYHGGTEKNRDSGKTKLTADNRGPGLISNRVIW